MGGMRLLPVIIASVGMLSSCVQQWHEAWQNDAKYRAYVESRQNGTSDLAEVQQAAAKATCARVHVIWNDDRKDAYIPLTAKELAVIQEMMPRMRDTPPLARQDWERHLYTLVSYEAYIYLEFWDAAAKINTQFPLHFGIGTREQADSYRHDNAIGGPPFFMLPEADLNRLMALPAIAKAFRD